MLKVASHLGLSNLNIIANTWLLTDAQGRKFLIDSGYPLERPQLRAQLWKAGVRKPGDLTAVLLTHRHSDHAGNAAWFQKHFQTPVACHHNDAQVLCGACAKPKQARGTAPIYQEWLNHFEDRFPARCQIDEEFEEGAWKWGFQVIHVPGHTEGSVMLYHEPTRTLFSGDAILAGPPPLRVVEGLRLALPGFSDDIARCHHNVKKFIASLPKIDWLAAGHGPAVNDQVFDKIKKLL